MNSLKNLTFFKTLRIDKRTENLAKSFFAAFHSLTKIFAEKTYNQMRSSP